MEKSLQELNALTSAGLIRQYAIGGAMAAFFYSEAVVTEDLDAFILIGQSTDTLISLTPVYDFLKSRGAREQREHLVVAGTLVQLIPAYDQITEEAVDEAAVRHVGRTPTRVVTAEHLIAIALKTGRTKDHARVATLLEEAAIDTSRLTAILERHELVTHWQRFKSLQS